MGVKGSVKFSVNGGRVEYNTFSVDGSDVLHAGIHGSESTLVVYPSLDAINELMRQQDVYVGVNDAGALRYFGKRIQDGFPQLLYH